MKNSLNPRHILPWLISTVLAGFLYISTLPGARNEADISYAKLIAEIKGDDLIAHYSNMTCILEELPIFPEDLKPHWIEDFGKNTTPSCIKIPTYTKLENRKLVVLNETKYCWGRCLERGSDTSYKAGNWTEAGKIMDCDTVEVLCGNSANRMIFFTGRMLDLREISSFLPKDNGSKYNVYIIMMDSVSAPHAKRTLTKTIEFFTKKMKAVEFPFMNRIGVNTYPNMMPFLTGRRIEKQTGSLWGAPVPNFSRLSNCGQLGDENNLFNIFKKHGYVTMFADNFLYPIQTTICSGYKDQLATHVGDNVFLRLLQGSFGRTSIFPRFCFDLTQIMYNYLDSFINSYPDYPKMALIMDVWSSHNGFNDNQLNDAKILNLLEKNFDKLKDSFVFLISDHGIRMSDAVHTRSGQNELNNPATFIAVPESLRENTEILSIVQENSKHLQTVMDTRETMLDIATVVRRDNYTNEELFEGEGITSSFLRTSVTAQLVGEAIVSRLNAILRGAGYSRRCFEWKLKTVISIEELLEIPNVYITEIKTKAPDAHFRSVIRYDDGINSAVGSFDRLDTFGDNGSCMSASFKHVCHCKNKKMVSST